MCVCSSITEHNYEFTKLHGILQKLAGIPRSNIDVLFPFTSFQDGGRPFELRHHKQFLETLAFEK